MSTEPDPEPPGHPHDGYAYDGCACVCCVNVRALATPSSVTPDLRALRDPVLTADVVKFVRWSANVRNDTVEAIAVARALNDRISERLVNDWWDSRAVLASVTPSEPTLDAAGLIAAERKRQIEAEGYDAAHDAGHADELAMAAAVYATPPDQRQVASGTDDTPVGWPWERRYYKPDPEWSTDGRIRELVKAGALIAAAIDDLSRGGPA